MPLNRTKKKKRKKKYKCHYGPTNTYIISSPLGEIFLTCCQFGIHCLQFGIQDYKALPNYQTPIAVLRQMWSDNGYTYKPAIETVEWLKAYFYLPQSVRNLSPPPVCKVAESSLLDAISLVLAGLPFGHVITSQQLIDEVGKDIPVNILHSIIETYPIQLVIPYHRIISWDDSLKISSYRKLKNCLLHHEKLHSS